MTLRLERLTARAGAFTLGELDLHIPARAHAVIVGPSGAGKSTLLAALAGTVSAGGSAWLGAAEDTAPARDARTGPPVDLLRLPPERRGVGFVPQGGLLFPHLTVRENVMYNGGDPAALEIVGAAPLAARRPRTLSGGEAMRVAIARALARAPRLVLLDEPLAGLDPAARAELRPLLASLRARAPVLHVTHDFDEAAALGTHLGVLLGGRLVAFGEPASLFARPPSEEVAAFLGVENVLAGIFTPGDSASLFLCGNLSLTVSGVHRGEGVLTFPGHAVALDGPGGSPRNTFAAEVVALEPLAAELRVRLLAQGVPLVSRVTRAAAAELALRPGARVTAQVKATALHAIPRARGVNG